MNIWINEQIDGCGLIQACIATTNQQIAEDCHANWQQELSRDQYKQGWQAIMRTVDSWDDVPVNALKLN
jgi:hypothetical protein